METLVSIVVPIYNVEKYLPICVNSIRTQTYQNLEIILVDDGSPDLCGKMCDDFAREDARIRVIHKENGGLSDARNAGLDIATGEYIACIDSDDIMAPEYIESLLNACMKLNTEVAICQVVDFMDGEDFTPFYSDNQSSYYIYSPVDAGRKFLYMNHVRTGVGGKLIKKNLYNEIRFEKGKFYEDLVPMFQIIIKANNVAISNDGLFGYRHRKSAQSRQAFTIKEMDAIDMADLLENVVETEYSELKKPLYSRTLSANFHILSMIPRKSYQQEQKRIWNNIKKYRLTVLMDKEGRKKARLAAMLSYGGRSITHFVLSEIIKRD